MHPRTGHILIAEDEVLVAHTIRLQLESRGYTVGDMATTGEAVLNILRRTRPDLILMDIRLAGAVDGIEAAEHVRCAYGIPVVFLTAFTDDATIERAKVTEPFGYLSKPFDDRDLVNTIEIALYRHRMRTALETSEAKFRGLFENAVIGLVLIDHERNTVEINRAMLELLGTGECTHPDDAVLKTMVDATRSSSGPVEQAVTLDDGKEHILQITATRIPNAPQSPPYTALFVEDVTELRRYEHDLENRRLALRALFMNEEAITGRERTRLSRDIHDVLGQMITAHRMDLHWLRSKACGADAVSGIDEMIDHTDEMIRFIRRVCCELRDNVLDDFGFDEALDEHIDRFRHRTGLTVKLVRTAEGRDLEHDRAVSLLRIIQEALTNVVRHANASSILIRSASEGGALIWTVEDDGDGFDTTAIDMVRSLGIVGMNERAASWGGFVRIASELGRGTKVRIELPEGGPS